MQDDKICIKMQEKKTDKKTYSLKIPIDFKIIILMILKIKYQGGKVFFRLLETIEKS